MNEMHEMYEILARYEWVIYPAVLFCLFVGYVTIFSYIGEKVGVFLSADTRVWANLGGAALGLAIIGIAWGVGKGVE